MFWINFFLITVIALEAVHGNGMMMKPTSRSSLWRIPKFENKAKVNINDNAINCGGVMDETCGLCGDLVNDPHPQKNENTGTYGKSIIAATYTSGDTIDVQIQLTANLLGGFNYSLCQLNDPYAPEPADCFRYNLQIVNGDGSVSPNKDKYVNKVKLPDGLRCNRCVFRWTYRAGNNWGTCDDGSQGRGCGPQLTYRNCADITIL